MELIPIAVMLTLLSFTLAQSDRGRNPPFQPAPFNGANVSKARRGQGGRRGGSSRETEGVAGPSEGTPNLHLHGAEDHNFTVPSEAPGPRDGDNESASEGDSLLERAIQLLQRLNDRLTALHALDEQQLRRLENLEYRLTRIEVQTQEKGDSIKSELREVSQRVRQLDWQSSKMEGTLDAIKLDTAGLKHGQDQLRGMHAGPEAQLSTLNENEMQNKMQMMATSMYTIRATVLAMKDDFSTIKKNITKLNNMTSHLVGLSSQLLTKPYFTNVMLDLKHDSAAPVQALPQALLSSLNNHNPTEESLPHDCWDVQQLGHNVSGIYRIRPVLSSVPFFVYCQLENRGGGWTVVQNRYEGTLDFYQGWQDYKHGFGNIGGEFWLGLEKLHTLTNYKVTELLIELQDFNLDNTYAHYSAFAVGTEVEGYPISFLGSYEGDAGDSLIYHAGIKFSTHDMDHDNWHDGNCAESHSGAWWYNGCDTSNLNGRYLNGELPESFEYQGMYWYDWHGPGYSLMASRMMVRPSKNFYLRDQEPRNKTSHRQDKKKNPHNTKATQGTHQNITEEAHQENPGIDDSPPVNEETHVVTEYPDMQLQYGDQIYDYQH